MSTQAIWRPMGLLLAAVLWLAASGLAAKAQSYAYGDDPTSSFSELDGYGDWFEHPEWGTVWAPHVDRDWRPYTVGSWAFTDEHGWYWESDEPFGWAVFHYGRWVFEDGAGWLWVPGTEWAPAWVAWRYSDEYVGWAPLPPRAEWREGAGLFFEDSYFNTGLSSVWFFVRPRNLLSPTVWRYRLPPSSYRDFYHRTRPATVYRWSNRRIVNVGIGLTLVERWSGQRVIPRRIVTVKRLYYGRQGVRRDGGIYVFRPRISPSPRWRDAARRDWRQNDRFRSFDAERRASRSRDDWRWQAQPRRDAPRLRREEADNWDRGRVLRNGERGGDGGPPRFDRDNPRFDDRFARRNFERVAPPERNRGQANRTERNRDLDSDRTVRGRDRDERNTVRGQDRRRIERVPPDGGGGPAFERRGGNDRAAPRDGRNRERGVQREERDRRVDRNLGNAAGQRAERRALRRQDARSVEPAAAAAAAAAGRQGGRGQAGAVRNSVPDGGNTRRNEARSEDASGKARQNRSERRRGGQS